MRISFGSEFASIVLGLLKLTLNSGNFLNLVGKMWITFKLVIDNFDFLNIIFRDVATTAQRSSVEII